MKESFRAGVRAPVAWVALLAALVTSLTVVLSRSMPWRGELGKTLGTVETMLALLGPAVAATVAFACAKWRKLNDALVLPTSRRRAWAVVSPALPSIVAGLAVWILVDVATVTTSFAFGPTDRLDLWPLPRTLALFALYVAIGLLIGSTAPPIPAGLIAGSVSYALFVIGTREPTMAFLAPFATAGSVATSRVDPPVALAQAVTIALLTCGLFLLAVGIQSPRRLSWTVVGFMVVASATGCALTTVVQQPLWIDRSPLEYVCGGEPVHVCLVRGNTGRIDDWALAVNEIAQRASALGWAVPARFEQFAGQSAPRGTGLLPISGLNINSDDPNPDEIASAIAGPSYCGQLAGGRWLPMRETLAGWLRAQLAPTRPSADPNLANWMRVAPISEQRAWAQRTQEALATCEPWPPPPFPSGISAP